MDFHIKRNKLRIFCVCEYRSIINRDSIKIGLSYIKNGTCASIYGNEYLYMRTSVLDNYRYFMQKIPISMVITDDIPHYIRI